MRRSLAAGSRDMRLASVGALLLGAGLALLVSAGITSAQSRHALVQLTVDRSLDVRPVWSPDGTQVAFQNNQTGKYQIWTMNVDGGDSRRLSRDESDDRHPIWSPDGKWIAFDAGSGQNREIWIMDTEGNNRRQLTSLNGVASFPSWSDDGKSIAFYLYKAGIADLWVMDSSGSTAKALTTGLADERKGSCTNSCHRPAWSPDSTTIAFSGGDHRTIWTIDARGGNMAQLTDGREHAHFPWYLPDGRLAYIAEYVQQGKSWTDVVVTDPANPSSTSRPLQGVSIQGPYEVSSDGERVLFHSPRGGNFDIYMADVGVPGGMDALTTSLVTAELAAGAPTPAPERASPLSKPGAAAAAAQPVVPPVPAPAAPAAPAPAAPAAPPVETVGGVNLFQAMLAWIGVLAVALVGLGAVQYARRSRRR
jgi:Tol biopolymer transport system component